MEQGRPDEGASEKDHPAGKDFGSHKGEHEFPGLDLRRIGQRQGDRKAKSPPDHELSRMQGYYPKERTIMNERINNEGATRHTYEPLKAVDVECIKRLGLDERIFGRWLDLAAFYDEAPVGFVALTRDGTIRNANLQATYLLNAFRSELLGRPLYDFVVEEDGDILDRHLENLFEQRLPQKCELRIRPQGRNALPGNGTGPGGIDSDQTGPEICQIRHILVESTYDDKFLDVHTSRTVFSDISHLKELERRLLLSQADMEIRVAQRTVQLQIINSELKKEIARRTKTGKRLKIAHKKLFEVHRRRLALSRKMVDLLEQERQSISRELHDNIGQMLTTVNMELQSLLQGDSESSPSPAQQDKIRTLEQRIRGTINDLRAICRQLRPDILDYLGLVPSIRQLVESVGGGAGLKMGLIAEDLPKMDNNQGLTLFRIAQEALTNVIRHAHAENVEVTLTRRNEYVVLTVEDDGEGFDARKREVGETVVGDGGVPAPTGFESRNTGTRNLGLLIMKERAFQAGGNVRVESEPGKGTRVIATVPIRPSGAFDTVNRNEENRI